MSDRDECENWSRVTRVPARRQDGLHFTPHGTEPIILGNETSDYPQNFGVAGGGTIVEDGPGAYRMYYTLAVGCARRSPPGTLLTHCTCLLCLSCLHIWSACLVYSSTIVSAYVLSTRLGHRWATPAPMSRLTRKRSARSRTARTA
jgi:hypothetical protein